MQDIKTISLGCRLNHFETELMKQQAMENKLDNIVIINTCAVTHNAHVESMQQVKKTKSNSPNATVLVTGCGATLYPEQYTQSGADIVIDNDHKFTHSILQKTATHDNDDLKQQYTIPTLKRFTQKTRAFIQIQQGCNHSCTFCIIHVARGKSQSLSEEHIIHQIQTAVDAHHQEVVLTGVDISSWNRDTSYNNNSQLGQLCYDILQKVPKLKRLRLSSLDPAVFDPLIIKLMRNEARFMPHLHFSLQAMNDKVLINMGRRHNARQASEFILQAQEANPQTVIGADIITGFPRETDEQFQDTYDAINKLNIALLHAFPYSERDGTVATKMCSLPMQIRKQRSKLLASLAHDLKLKLFAQKNTQTLEVLFEKNNIGYSKEYLPVKLIDQEIQPNTIAQVIVKNYNDKYLLAQRIEDQQ